MDFRILGPLEASADGRVVALDAPKHRALLAILLLHANEPVGSDRLIEDLWAGRPPATAAKVLQTYVSQLRKALGDDDRHEAGRVRTLRRAGRSRSAAIRASRDPGARRRAAGRSADPARCPRVWRGTPLAEFAYEPWAQPEIGRLAELRLAALQDRIDADLALGRHGELVAELERLVAEHPLSERLRGQLMLALYRSGRQAEALDAYRSARATLVEELGIEPGSALRSLERAILIRIRSSTSFPSRRRLRRRRGCGCDRPRSSVEAGSSGRSARCWARQMCVS